MHFEVLIVEMDRETPLSAVVNIVGANEDSNWRILKHYFEEARKYLDLSSMSVLRIDEFLVEKLHLYVTLFYAIKNSRVIP